MKQKTKIAFSALLVVLSLTVMFVLVSCGEATTYNYKDVKIEAYVEGEPMSSEELAQLNPMFEPIKAMYAETKIEVSSNSVKVISSDTTNEMQIEKDGDKDLLAGEFVESMIKTYQALDPDCSVEMYGMAHDDNYDLVIDVYIMGLNTVVTITYEK